MDCLYELNLSLFLFLILKLSSVVVFTKLYKYLVLYHIVVKAIILLLLVETTLWAMSRQMDVSVKAMWLLSAMFFRISAVFLSLLFIQMKNIPT